MFELEILLEKLAKAKRISVLTGAGVSAESGIATFRDPDGMWSKLNPMELASMEGFMANPELVWQWYQFRRSALSKAIPNAGHFALAELQNMFESFSLSTQNVDRLHQTAGSRNVNELHGNIVDNYCVACKADYLDPIDYEIQTPILCKKCSGNIRPAVVWFGEMLPEEALNAAAEATENCDVYFSIGTSAEVYPAANLPMNAKRNGAFLVEINPNHTSLTSYVDYKLDLPSAIALPQIVELLKTKFL